jgi:hypothetical protein
MITPVTCRWTGENSFSSILVFDASSLISCLIIEMIMGDHYTMKWVAGGGYYLFWIFSTVAGRYENQYTAPRKIPVVCVHANWDQLSEFGNIYCTDDFQICHWYFDMHCAGNKINCRIISVYKGHILKVSAVHTVLRTSGKWVFYLRAPASHTWVKSSWCSVGMRMWFIC